MLKIQHLHAGYGKTEILHDINLTAEKGTITTILGCNGSGKSTLLKSIVKAIPYEGQIWVSGMDSKKLSSQELAQQVAYLSQGKNVPDISVGRMVLHGRFPYLSYPRRYRKEDYEIAQEAMKQMDIAALSEQPMAELSGGMRQKVYLAMALAQQAPVIVMDEPTTYLDIGQQLKFAQLARQLADSGKTVLLVLHDILMALQLSDQILVLEKGRITEQGTAQSILDSKVLERIYDVRIGFVDGEKGRQYYYER